MSLRVVIWSTLVCGTAAADRAIAVDVGPTLPFSPTELADALRVRLDASGAPVHIRVAAGDGGVVVDAGRGSRTVGLGGRAGAEAARLVALVAVDLLLDDLARAPAIEARVAPPSTVAPIVAPVPGPSVGLVASVATWSGVMAGAALDVAVPRGRFVASLELGGDTLVGGGLQLQGVMVRLGGGYRGDGYELRAGATIAPIDVSDGVGDRTVLVGANASARLRLPLGDRTRLVLIAGIDAFTTRTEYRMTTGTIATPWVAPWLATGIEVTP